MIVMVAMFLFEIPANISSVKYKKSGSAVS